DLDVDYLTKRGPALGTTFQYAGSSVFGVPTTYAGQVKAMGMYDDGTDILGGIRGPEDHHPLWRGSVQWYQAFRNLPDGFTVRTGLGLFSDHNYYEQYQKPAFDMDVNQETYVYVEQQHNNWAWTFLTEARVRNWVTETEWLPRADGYLIGQSFF